MTETLLSDSEALALAGATDPDTDFVHHTVGQATYYLDGYRQRHRVLTIVKVVNALRVYKDGEMTFGVRPGRYLDGDTPVDYPGAEGAALTDDSTNYIYMTAAGALIVNTTAFPNPSETPHLPLATIVVVSGSYGHADITDYRGRMLLGAVGGVRRGDLAVQAAVEHPVALCADCRNTDGAAIDATGGAGRFHAVVTANAPTLSGETAQGDTQADSLLLELPMPVEYDPAGYVGVTVNAVLTGAGTAGTCTVDVEARLLDVDGSAGADLVATAAQSLSGSGTDHAFSLDASGLSPGDKLCVKLTTSVQETSGSNLLAVSVNSIRCVADIRG